MESLLNRDVRGVVMTITVARDPQFKPAAETAIELLHIFTLELGTHARQNSHERDVVGRMLHLAADAYRLSLAGLHLIGPFDRHDPPSADELLPALQRTCDDLVEHSSAMDGFEVLSFVGQFSDIVRGVKRLGLLD